MAEPFKNLINAALVQRAAKHLLRAWPDFDAARFERLAATGLDQLELKARAMQLADALEATLPADFDAAAAVIEAALAPAAEDEDLGALHGQADGLQGWVLWGAGEFVARRGIEAPARALACLREITQRFTAEFAIRPLIAAHAQLAFATLHAWVDDPSPHVRRLVSEGSRPRLPWGLRLQALVADPTPTLPLLLRLQDDASDYVRKSVANHLNDIAKDHPDVVAEWLETHLPGAPAPRRALLRHASRTLIKQGHPRVLAAWGLGGRFKGQASFSLKPARVAVGGEVQFALTLTSTSRSAQALVVDYAVHHVKADGSTSPKVFKGWNLTLAAGEQRELAKRHSLKLITTRRYHAGLHRVTVQVNGAPVAETAFTLKL